MGIHPLTKIHQTKSKTREIQWYALMRSAVNGVKLNIEMQTSAARDIAPSLASEESSGEEDARNPVVSLLSCLSAPANNFWVPATKPNGFSQALFDEYGCDTCLCWKRFATGTFLAGVVEIKEGCASPGSIQLSIYRRNKQRARSVTGWEDRLGLMRSEYTVVV